MKITDKLSSGMYWLETASGRLVYPALSLAILFLFAAAETLLNGV